MNTNKRIPCGGDGVVAVLRESCDIMTFQRYRFENFNGVNKIRAIQLRIDLVTISESERLQGQDMYHVLKLKLLANAIVSIISSILSHLISTHDQSSGERPTRSPQMLSCV